MKQILIKCNYNSAILYKLRECIDYLKETNIDFKVYLPTYEINLFTLNIKLNFIPADALKNYNGDLKIIDYNNFSIKEILGGDK